MVQTWEPDSIWMHSWTTMACSAENPSTCIHSARMQAYPGLWECHYGLSKAQCGEVKQVDVATKIGVSARVVTAARKSGLDKIEGARWVQLIQEMAAAEPVKPVTAAIPGLAADAFIGPAGATGIIHTRSSGREFNFEHTLTQAAGTRWQHVEGLDIEAIGDSIQ